MATRKLTDATFSKLIAEVSKREIDDLKMHGIDVHFIDAEGRSILEKPDGRRFEVEYLSHGSYRIVRELDPIPA